MRALLAVALFVLAACGADGEPEPVEPRGSGGSVSGEARIGVSGAL